jgi:hypothetical protein
MASGLIKEIKMYQSRADIDQNRLYVTLKGRIASKESEQAASQVIADLKKLKSGFDVVTDISEFEPATQKEVDMLIQVHKILIESGVNRIARVVGSGIKATVGKIQFERASKLTTVVAENFDSIEDADCYLDG